MKAMRYAILALGALVAGLSSADVFKDVLGYYCGGVDLGGDGVAAPSEIKDARRVGIPSAKSHQIEPHIPSTTLDKRCATNSVRWTVCDVDCAVAGVTLKNQRCLEFTSIKTDPSTGAKSDTAYGFNLPFNDDVGAGKTNQPMTVLFRYRLPEAEANVNAAGEAYTSGRSFLCDFGYDNGNRCGFRFGVNNSPTVNSLYFDIGKNAYKDDICFTNEDYQTRGACWNEVALILPCDNTSGLTLKLYQPGRSVYTRDFKGQNGTLGVDGQMTIGRSSNSTSYGTAFRGKMHMFAVWNRVLSDAEINEAFNSLPHTDGDEFAYRPGKPVFRIGNQDYGNDLFAGAEDSTVVLSEAGADVRTVPHRMAAGAKVSITAELSKYETNYNHIVRIGTADAGSSGTFRLTVGGVTVGDIDVQPNAFASLLVPAACLDGETVGLDLECLAAGAEGVALKYFDLHGAWSMGIKDKSKADFPGNQLTPFYVGESEMERFPRGVGSTRTIAFQLPQELCEGYRYAVDLAIFQGSVNKSLGLTVNGTTIMELQKVNNNQDLSFTIPNGILQPYPETNRIVTSFSSTAEGAWADLDYFRLRPVKARSSGMIIIFR